MPYWRSLRTGSFARELGKREKKGDGGGGGRTGGGEGEEKRESNRRDILKRSEEVLVEVLGKLRSVCGTYVQKPEQKEAIEHLLKGPNILAV